MGGFPAPESYGEHLMENSGWDECLACNNDAGPFGEYTLFELLFSHEYWVADIWVTVPVGYMVA